MHSKPGDSSNSIACNVIDGSNVLDFEPDIRNYNIDKELIKINFKERRAFFVVKRIADIVLSLIALIVLAPLLLLIAIMIRLESKGGVIFSQLRTGKDGKKFKMYKFRSMCEGAEEKRDELLEHNEMDAPVFKISKDPRVTRIGRFIRKTSIDELPQLINIIKGEMSIVGPRPLVIYETEEFNEYENQRHMVRPGLTCYWQISGRNNISFNQWIPLDIKYIKEMSTWTDFKIILKTIYVVITGKGAC